MAADSKIYLREDEWEQGQWRVEYFGKDGGCYVTIFAGPRAEERARDYLEALMAGIVTPHRG
jgi:hypothetical protein